MDKKSVDLEYMKLKVKTGVKSGAMPLYGVKPWRWVALYGIEPEVS